MLSSLVLTHYVVIMDESQKDQLPSGRNTSYLKALFQMVTSLTLAVFAIFTYFVDYSYQSLWTQGPRSPYGPWSFKDLIPGQWSGFNHNDYAYSHAPFRYSIFEIVSVILIVAAFTFFALAIRTSRQAAESASGFGQ